MPFRLYIYNDLPYTRGEARPSAYDALVAWLLAALQRARGVTILEVEDQVERLSRLSPRPGTGATLAIGQAGLRVARLLDARTGWFPAPVVAPLTRIETAPGEYRLSEESLTWLEQTLPALAREPVSIVDDTLYSGLTLLELLRRLPPRVLAGSVVFCLQAIAERLPAVRADCPVRAGSELPGRIDEEVSVVKASHLFEPGAIRRLDGTDLAFYERPEWMQRWFAEDAAQITALCARLVALERDAEA